MWLRWPCIRGMKVPVNGALPLVIEVSAESSKTVLTNPRPLAPPTAENSGIMSPFGATRTAVRPESADDAMVSVTVMSAIWRVLFELTVSVESSVPGPAVVAAAIA